MRFTTNVMCVKKNTHVVRISRNRMSRTYDLYCCLVPQCEALRTCCSAFLITTKWWFDKAAKVVPGTTFTKRTCNGCGSLQKRGYAVATSGIALYWECGFRMANAWKWVEKMNMYLDLNLAAFWYIDGFGCYHFCLNIFGLELMIFFWTSLQLSILGLQITVTFGSVLGLQVIVGLQVNTELQLPTRWEPFVAGKMLSRSELTKEIVEPTILSIIAIEIIHLTRYGLLLLLRILRYMWCNHVATWA